MLNPSDLHGVRYLLTHRPYHAPTIGVWLNLLVTKHKMIVIIQVVSGGLCLMLDFIVAATAAE